MKVNLAPKQRTLTKPRLGEEVTRFNFFLPVSAREELEKLNLLLQELKVGTKLTMSYAVREGFNLFLKEQRRVLSLAKSGNLHAKRR